MWDEQLISQRSASTSELVGDTHTSKAYFLKNVQKKIPRDFFPLNFRSRTFSGDTRLDVLNYVR